MVFEYDAYWRNLCSVPVFGIVWSVIILLVGIIVLAYFAISKKKEKMVITLVTLLLAIVFLPLNNRNDIINLQNGGIYLLEEKEDAAITGTGTIENIVEPSELFPQFKGYHNGKYKYGADITIDGKIYLAIDSGDFDVGDRVIITYLPKSRVILSIYAVDE